MKQIARNTKNIVGKGVKRTLLSNGSELQFHCAIRPVALLVIFEARLDCLPQISALSFASANGLVLKGRKNAVSTNRTLMSIVSEALLTHGVQQFIQMVAYMDD